MSVYLVLLVSTISIPLLLSFDKKLQFYRQWKYLLPSLVMVAFLFIIFDIWFTRLGIWGFNAFHHSPILLFNLPLEEWLFFLIVPYASIFLHESLVLYFPRVKLSEGTCRAITLFLIISFTLVAIFNIDKTYTLYSSGMLVFALLLSFFDPSKVLRYFYFTFIVILIPFMVVNGVLTGSGIEEEVVWYNNQENLGIRIFTIPVEDFGYGFSLILLNLLLKAQLKKRATIYH